MKTAVGAAAPDPDPAVRAEARAIHIILATTPGTTVVQVTRAVRDETILLAKLGQPEPRRKP